MNILQAIDEMRAGSKVRRRSNIGISVGKSWLTIERVLLEDDPDGDRFATIEDEEDAKVDVIYFNVEAITEAHNWVGCYPAVKNPWKPSQADLFADDFVTLA